jgi:hypothetical protein
VIARLLSIPARRGPRDDVAHFAHYTGWAWDEAPGYVMIGRVTGGWSWRIPLRDRLSVGVVLDRGVAQRLGDTPLARLEASIAGTPELAATLRDATRASGIATYSNYQLVTTRGFGPGWVAAGDAFGFVDPMLSPGTSVALRSAEWLADALAPALHAARSGPRVDAGLGAEDPLVRAGVHHVVPHPRDRGEEVRHLVTRRRRVPAHRPGVCGRAVRAAGGDEHVRLTEQQVRQGEGVPCAPAPPQRLRAHDREAQRDRREGVCHQDFVIATQHHVPCLGELSEEPVNLSQGQIEDVRQLRRTRCKAPACERGVHRQPYVLGLHGLSLESSGEKPSAPAVVGERLELSGACLLDGPEAGADGPAAARRVEEP